ncbi:MAG: hypothetical protein ACYDA0_12710 [Candidatus Dormibacteraceae bacterium]
MVFALFSLGYILGVWTACAVFRQPQLESEEAIPASSTPVIVRGDASCQVGRLP